jgi:CRP-like cAMP-binding protein
VNQDNVSLKKLLGAGRVYKKRLSDVDLAAIQEEENVLDAFFQLPRKKQVLTLIEKGISRSDMCKVLGITRENLRDILRRLKKDSRITP